MQLERSGSGTSLVDVLDRVLDKGVIIDAFVSVSLVGFEIISVQARVVVASVSTYLQFAEAIGQVPAASRPPVAIETVPESLRALAAENIALEAEWAKTGQSGARSARARSRS